MRGHKPGKQIRHVFKSMKIQGLKIEFFFLNNAVNIFTVQIIKDKKYKECVGKREAGL